MQFMQMETVMLRGNALFGDQPQHHCGTSQQPPEAPTTRRMTDLAARLLAQFERLNDITRLDVIE
jgi:hypothetical protein